MTATTGSDSSGPVAYFFDEISGNAGGTDSGWQVSASYTDSGLMANTTYTYRVRMRDSRGNVGSWSTPENATTDPAGDTITIIKVEYTVSRSQLNVEATSSYGSAVTLTVVGYGDMSWDSKKHKFKYKEKPVPDPGGSVTVISTSGGSANATVTHK